MTIKIRLHTDLMDEVCMRGIPYGHYHTVQALANYRMMRQEDLDDLPNTAMQRFLMAADACVAGRTYVGAREAREVLRETAAEFGLDWGAFAEAAERAGVDELTFEEAWELFERWVYSGETLTSYMRWVDHMRRNPPGSAPPPPEAPPKE